MDKRQKYNPNHKLYAVVLYNSYNYSGSIIVNGYGNMITVKAWRNGIFYIIHIISLSLYLQDKK